MGIPLYTHETLLKYIGGLCTYLRRTILTFNPTNIEKVVVQAIHLDTNRGKHGFEDVYKDPHNFKKYSKGERTSKKKAIVKKEKERLHVLIARRKDMIKVIVGSYI